MLPLAALAVAVVFELAAAALFLRGSAPLLTLALHALCAALVLVAFRLAPGARRMAALAVTLALLLPVLGVLGVSLVFLTAKRATADEVSESLLRDFSEYVTFKGHWGERRRFGKDVSNELARETAVQPLVDMATDNSEQVRRAGIRAAGRRGGGAALAALHTLALSREPVLRYSAARELEMLEDAWLAEVSAAEAASRRDPGDPAPCLASARLVTHGADVAILGEASSHYLRERAIEAWREYRRRGGDAAEAVLTEARLLVRNGRRGEAADLILAHRREGEPSPDAELLKAEIAAAAGNLDLLREQVKILRAGKATPAVSGYLAFLDTP